MASVAKRPNGSWRARYRDSEGREHARHFARKVDADRWLDEIVGRDGSMREQAMDPARGATRRIRRAAQGGLRGRQRAERPVALYRHFDAEGNLLYLGITVDVGSRTNAHAGYAEWAPLAATGTIVWYPSEQEARDAEYIALKREQPRFNQVRGKHAPWLDPEVAAAILAERNRTIA